MVLISRDVDELEVLLEDSFLITRHSILWEVVRVVAKKNDVIYSTGELGEVSIDSIRLVRFRL